MGEVAIVLYHSSTATRVTESIRGANISMNGRVGGEKEGEWQVRFLEQHHVRAQGVVASILNTAMPWCPSVV